MAKPEPATAAASSPSLSRASTLSAASSLDTDAVVFVVDASSPAPKNPGRFLLNKPAAARRKTRQDDDTDTSEPTRPASFTASSAASDSAAEPQTPTTATPTDDPRDDAALPPGPTDEVDADVDTKISSNAVPLPLPALASDYKALVNSFGKRGVRAAAAGDDDTAASADEQSNDKTSEQGSADELSTLSTATNDPTAAIALKQEELPAATAETNEAPTKRELPNCLFIPPVFTVCEIEPASPVSSCNEQLLNLAVPAVPAGLGPVGDLLTPKAASIFALESKKKSLGGRIKAKVAKMNFKTQAWVDEAVASFKSNPLGLARCFSKPAVEC
jgi:hypothetical protein